MADWISHGWFQGFKTLSGVDKFTGNADAADVGCKIDSVPVRTLFINIFIIANLCSLHHVLPLSVGGA